MKKTAKEKLKSTSKIIQPEEKVVTPPDVVNPEDAQFLKNEKLALEGSTGNDNVLSLEEEKSKESSFYEKVMGKKSTVKFYDSKEESENNSQKNGSFNWKLFFLGGFVFLLTIFMTTLIGLIILSSAQKIVRKNVNNTKNVAPKPTPTLAPTINRKEWSFEVLNGSDTIGAAAKAADKLKALGYEVVKIGNAQENVSTTQLFVSKDKSDADTKLLLNDLKFDFGQLTVTDVLSDSTATVRIILGSK